MCADEASFVAFAANVGRSLAPGIRARLRLAVAVLVGSQRVVPFRIGRSAESVVDRPPTASVT